MIKAMTTDESRDVAVLETEDGEQASSCSLVLSSVNISHTVTTEGTSYIIHVKSQDANMAVFHLDAYRAENRNWPPPQYEIEQSSALQPPTFLVIGGLILFHLVTGPWSAKSSWFINGAGDASLILERGEFFRLITPLTLHADLTHLMGNCLLGGFLLHFFLKTTGPGLGLFSMLTSAILGNYINVQVHGGDHRFVGFSTAVFAIIGMLSTISMHRRKEHSLLQMVLPFMAGAGLLAMTGSSGERVDLGAHFFGLLSGFATGGLLVSQPVATLRHSSFFQFLLFLASTAIVFLSWEIAMQKVY